MSSWLLLNIPLAILLIAAVIGGAFWVAFKPEITGAGSRSPAADAAEPQAAPVPGQRVAA